MDIGVLCTAEPTEVMTRVALRRFIRIACSISPASATEEICAFCCTPQAKKADLWIKIAMVGWPEPVLFQQNSANTITNLVRRVPSLKLRLNRRRALMRFQSPSPGTPKQSLARTSRREPVLGATLAHFHMLQLAAPINEPRQLARKDLQMLLEQR